MGPSPSAWHFLTNGRVKDAVAKGATLRTGGTFEGHIYQPTSLTDVPLDTAVANDSEIRG
jgi:acyl-CoA reductase-like NAD-dependent aldehyde dehydrogenase